MLLFLSYASADSDIANRLHDLLAPHIDVFIGSRYIRGGGEWEREIDAACSPM